MNKCMAEFMNGKLKFSEMSRLQRISCTKELRSSMENRIGKLLQAEPGWLSDLRKAFCWFRVILITEVT